jgi:hypothetical protein
MLFMDHCTFLRVLDGLEQITVRRPCMPEPLPFCRNISSQTVAVACNLGGLYIFTANENDVSIFLKKVQANQFVSPQCRVLEHGPSVSWPSQPARSRIVLSL